MDQAAGDLRQLAGELEEHFLLTSGKLETLASTGEEFVQQTVKLVNTATGRVDGSEVFFSAMAIVEQPLAFLTSSHARSTEFLRALKEDIGRIEGLIRAQSEIERTIAPLKYIQALFKIESATLGGEVQGMFGSLTRDIEQLHDQICELFSTKFIELRNIKTTVNEVVQELQFQTETLWGTIATERVQIDESLQHLQKELADNQQRELRISSLSRQVNQEIQQVVVGLQYQDIINQKLEHTSIAFDEMDAEVDPAQDRHALERSCRLQAGQIQAIRDDMAGAENTVRHGTEKILAHLVNADSHCVSLEEFQQLTATADGMVQALLDIFATLRKEITIMAESCTKAFEKLQSISGLASNMTVVVRDLSQRIHLIGLNAQIQAALVVKGVGLEVLSARTSEISRATNQISEDVARQLDQLVVGLTGSVAALEGMGAAALKQQNILNREGVVAENRLHSVRNETRAGLTSVTALLGEVRTGAQGIIETLTYVENYDGTLGEIQSKLGALAESFDASSPLTNPKAGGAVHQMRHKYTMASERQVYAKVMGGEALSFPEPESEAVELFHRDEPIGASASEPIAEPLAVSTATPLPLSPADPVAGLSAGSTSPPPPSVLGNNVELF